MEYKKNSLRKREGILLFGILLIALFFQVGNVDAQEQATYCAEKTNDGFSCQNVPFDQVDTDFRYAPTSCEATSYCKIGICANSNEGMCVKSPRTTCDPDEGGIWYDGKAENIPLCQTGCCLIGDQAAFVTQTRCQALSSQYGLEINFRADISSESECIANAIPKAKGACVYETDSGRTCDFTTRQECNDFKESTPSAEFNEGLLCSNPDLGADCGLTKQTTCLTGKDEVYFVDSCGNPANIYDASKVDEVNYWSYVPGLGGVEVGGEGQSNSGSINNGNCNYYLGSTCKEYDRALDSNAPEYGNYICRNLGCEWEGVSYNHGETWCAEGQNPGISGETAIDINKTGNVPGSRDVRLVCYNGEVTVEPCADFRQEICIQTDVDNRINETFSNAVCRANRWRDCYSQDSKRGCENGDERDCQWISGENSISILKGEEGEELVWNVEEDKLVPKSNYLDENRVIARVEDIPGGASCVPRYTPGFDFWNEGTEAVDICNLGSRTCVVQYEQGIFESFSDEWNVVQYKDSLWGLWTKTIASEGILEGGIFPGERGREKVIVCLDNDGKIVETWGSEIENTCSMLGDCGVSVNYKGAEGYYETYKEGSEDDLFVVEGSLD